MIRTQKFLKFCFCSYYKILNVSENATTEEIKKSFNQLAKKYHPDTGNMSQDQFIKIKQAYDTLRNSDSRSRYDFQKIHGKPSQRRKYYYYYGDNNDNMANSKRNTFWNMDNMRTLSNLAIICVFIVVIYLSNARSDPMTEHQIRRQNIILANQKIYDSPSAQQKRRKMYQKQMKEKNITSRVITLKVSNSARQSTKARNIKKNSIDGIPGIQKQKKQPIIAPTEQYM